MRERARERERKTTLIRERTAEAAMRRLQKTLVIDDELMIIIDEEEGAAGAPPEHKPSSSPEAEQARALAEAEKDESRPNGRGT